MPSAEGMPGARSFAVRRFHSDGTVRADTPPPKTPPLLPPKGPHAPYTNAITFAELETEVNIMRRSLDNLVLLVSDVRCVVSHGQGCIGREGTSEVAPEAVGQAVGGGCRSGWGRLLSVTNAIEAGTWRQGDSGWA